MSTRLKKSEAVRIVIINELVGSIKKKHGKKASMAYHYYNVLCMFNPVIITVIRDICKQLLALIHSVSRSIGCGRLALAPLSFDGQW